MTLAAFLHGYPPGWSMGGEVSTHRTLREVEGSLVFTKTETPYTIDGVQVRPLSGEGYQDIIDMVDGTNTRALFAHSTMSANTVRAARKMGLPSILAVHAPPRYAADLRRAWGRATIRLYNTEQARMDWKDPRGLLLHPPAGPPVVAGDGPRDAYTLSSSLLNKGVLPTLDLAKSMPDQRFIIMESPAHATHGAEDFAERAAELPNVEVWPRLHPNEMGKLWAETRILLVPSRYETYGLSAIEAAAHGIPSVHVDTPHVREGIGDGAYLLKSTTAYSLDIAVRQVEDSYPKWAAKALVRALYLAEREQRELAAFTASVAALTGK